MLRYEHTQPATAIVIAFVLAFAACFVPIRIAPETRPVVLAVAGGLVLCLWLFSSLTIAVSDRALRWHFGTGWIRKEVLLADIESAEPARTTVLQGWGIHWTRRGWLYNVSGFTAVAITLRGGTRLLLGTDEPEQLLAVLREARRRGTG